MKTRFLKNGDIIRATDIALKSKTKNGKPSVRVQLTPHICKGTCTRRTDSFVGSLCIGSVYNDKYHITMIREG